MIQSVKAFTFVLCIDFVDPDVHHFGGGVSVELVMTNLSSSRRRITR